jgi:hypothetical protein
VDVVADLPADAEPTHPVQQGDGLLHDPPVDTEAGAVRAAPAADDRLDAFDPNLAAVAVVVVAPVGVQRGGAAARTTRPAADRRDLVEQRQQLGDVVAVSTGQADRQRDPVGVGEDMVFGARPRVVDRARTGFGPPLSARTWELSITALDQSSRSAPCSSASSSSCSRCHTRPDASRAAAASRSSPSRTPTPAAGTPTGSRYATRTRSRTAPCGHRAVSAPGTETGAPAWAATARGVPTARPARSTEAAGPSSCPRRLPPPRRRNPIALGVLNTGIRDLRHPPRSVSGGPALFHWC